ncbi:tripartite tricarboxylate transporter TctB family protein [Marinobacter sp. F3R11]|uniref:tripartite tricarboxylate transporter TctB family protein n=1 Tax=Marinobacter sp. F3R11 TaxID=2267231 RepID=UPI000DE92CCA|nr:tripartite tricarboxylate transporter TctB family protein [Marinobacter sp. F3R11]RBW48490.1 tripartite tricarboxylate transporter TctB family protein [Marinobacter sp. F3R11]
MDRRKLDVILSAVLITTSIIILTNDSLVEGGVESELGSMFLPRVIAALIIIFSASIGISSVRGLLMKAEASDCERLDVAGFSGIFLYIGIFVAYWFLVPLAGFLITTPFVMFAIALLLGGRNWIPIITMSVVTPVIIYYGSLHFLRVYLPVWNLS